ncbi:MAG: delta-60 repeat domain-containing protein [Flavobacteriales bacterium]|nr:hypothetical protein [Flavobacteriales bacterium]MCC6577162.1 delta-60 repeat domain-containing protein [Flavobacteriales bacterium]NUQ15009.1 delta-60 repeat domain-containing protein [Flavobacteriales bacterium]
MKHALLLWMVGFSALTVHGQHLVLDPTFNAGTGFTAPGVEALAVQVDGRILCGGGFRAYNGTPLFNIARLYPDGALDMGFAPTIEDTLADGVLALLVRPDGGIVMAGEFEVVDLLPCGGLVHLLPNGTVYGGYGSTNGAMLFSLALTPGGELFVGGHFEVPWGATLRVFNSGGSGIYTGSGPAPFVLKAQPDGRVVAGTNTAPTVVVRYLPNGQLDPDFTSDVTGTWALVRDLTILPDGRIVVVGDFDTVDGQPRANIARLMPDGSLDATFDPGTGFDAVCVAVDVMPSGSLLVGTYSSTYDGTPLQGELVQLHPDGQLDTSYQVTGLNEIHVLQDGRVLIAGTWTTFGNSLNTGIHRLMPEIGTAVPVAGTAAAPFTVYVDRAGVLVATSGGGAAELHLFDVAGREVRSFRTTAPVERIGLSGIGTGVFVAMRVDERGVRQWQRFFVGG